MRALATALFAAMFVIPGAAAAQTLSTYVDDPCAWRTSTRPLTVTEKVDGREATWSSIKAAYR